MKQLGNNAATAISVAATVGCTAVVYAIPPGSEVKMPWWVVPFVVWPFGVGVVVKAICWHMDRRTEPKQLRDAIRQLEQKEMGELGEEYEGLRF